MASTRAAEEGRARRARRVPRKEREKRPAEDVDGWVGGGREEGTRRVRGRQVGRGCGNVERGTWSGWAKSALVGGATCGLCVNLAVDRVSQRRASRARRAPFSRRLTQRFPSGSGRSFLALRWCDSGGGSWEETWRWAKRSESFGLRRTAGKDSGTGPASGSVSTWASTMVGSVDLARRPR